MYLLEQVFQLGYNFLGLIRLHIVDCNSFVVAHA